MNILRLSSDESFNNELQRILGLANYGGADVGEVLATAGEIWPGVFESFHDAWVRRAEQICSQRRRMVNTTSIRDSMFRASTYYRAASLFIHGGDWDDPRIRALWKKQRECFDEAMAMLSVPGYRKLIPTAAGFDVPVIFFPAARKDEANLKRPTILVGPGFHDSMEDAYHQYGVAALERGWNVVCYEGPGQGSVRREQGRGFIHNWETVVSPVIGYLETISCVDTAIIGIIGHSLGGGFLTLRAAMFDPRITAIISVDPICDLLGQNALFSEQFLEQFVHIWDFDGVREVMRDGHISTPLRWALAHGLWSFNVQTPTELLQKIRKFSLKESQVSGIRCPMFIGKTTVDDDSAPCGSKPRTMKGIPYVAFTEPTTTGTAASVLSAGGLQNISTSRLVNQVIFDWFDRKVVRKRRIQQLCQRLGRNDDFAAKKLRYDSIVSPPR